MSPSREHGAALEAALSDLISQLDRGSFEPAAEAAGARAVAALEAAQPHSLEAGAQARVKRLHSVALGLLAERRKSISAELERVRVARELLRTCARPQRGAGLTGGDCDVSG